MDIDPINTMDYEFDFGKFEGYSYQYVLNQDPFYIQWVLENFKYFKLDDMAMKELEAACAD